MSEKNLLKVVREHFPMATDKEADWLLWETTAFPFCSTDTVRRQLAAAARKSNGCIPAAVEIAHLEMWIALERASLARALPPSGGTR